MKKFLRKLFKDRIDLKILMNKKEEVLNLYAQTHKQKDTTKLNYYQGQIDLLEGIISAFK